MRGGKQPGAGRKPLPALTREQAAQLLERLAAEVRANHDPDNLPRQVLRDAQRVRRSLLKEGV